MNLEPLLDSPAPIPGHAVVVSLRSPSARGSSSLPRTIRHRVVGWIWIGLLVYVAVSGLFIHQLRMSRRMARRLPACCGSALVVAGAFTFFPGRVMWLVATGG